MDVLWPINAFSDLKLKETPTHEALLPFFFQTTSYNSDVEKNLMLLIIAPDIR